MAGAVTGPTNVHKGWEFHPLQGIKSKPTSLGSVFYAKRTQNVLYRYL